MMEKNIGLGYTEKTHVFVPELFEDEELAEMEKDSPFGERFEVNKMFCEEYNLNCEETCCEGIQCAEARDFC